MRRFRRLGKRKRHVRTIIDVQMVRCPRARRFGVRECVHMILGGKPFRAQSIWCSRPCFYGCKQLCECVPKTKKGLPKIVSLWLVRVHTSVVLAESRAAACKRKIALLPTAPCLGGLCLLPAPKGKQRVGERIGDFGSSLPDSQASCAFWQRLASAQRSPQAATNPP